MPAPGALYPKSKRTHKIGYVAHLAVPKHLGTHEMPQHKQDLHFIWNIVVLFTNVTGS